MLYLSRMRPYGRMEQGRGRITKKKREKSDREEKAITTKNNKAKH